MDHHQQQQQAQEQQIEELFSAQLREALERGGSLSPSVDVSVLSARVLRGATKPLNSLYDLRELACELAVEMTVRHPDYGRLAGRLYLWNLYERTPAKFSEAMTRLDEARLLDPGFASLVRDPIKMQEIDEMVRLREEQDVDFAFHDYSSICVLASMYLTKERVLNGGDDSRSKKNNLDVPIERPQHLLMRVALALHGYGENAFTTYRCMSDYLYTHATPTMLNAGFRGQHLASCYLVSLTEDSIDGIYDSLRKCALCSKSGGGLGINVSSIRAKGAAVDGGMGRSSGLVPLLRVFNNTARYVDQGGGKRPGAFAIYLEPWHADVEDVIRLSHKFGAEEERARDLYFALWINDLFMCRVRDDEWWSLMCPRACPQLNEVWGPAFEALYLRYEEEGRYVRRIKARVLWDLILSTQIETGMPFMLYKDHVNRRCNQSHVGIIKGSNLCTEILLPSSKDEIAVCNIASICLPRFLTEDRTKLCRICRQLSRRDFSCAECAGGYDFGGLYETTRVAIRSLDRTIDLIGYCTPEAKRANERHRPVGLGVQGFADVLAASSLAWSDEMTRVLNRRVFETVYRASLRESCELAKRLGRYESYDGSPLQRDGLLQIDLWNEWVSETNEPELRVEGTRDEIWREVRDMIKLYGLRNAERTACMPTASTSLVMRNTESVDPRMSNLYIRRVISGEFVVINPYLVRDLERLDLWNDETRRALVAENGSVQKINWLPERLRQIYRTAWEVSQKDLLDLAIERSPYLDQSQSLNVYLAKPNVKKLTALHFYGWKNGLKTGMYYLRGRPCVNPIQFTLSETKNNNPKAASTSNENLDVTTATTTTTTKEEVKMCTMFDTDCEFCSG